MQRGKRTNFDFSEHHHRIDIYKNAEKKEIRIDHLQIGDSNTNYIQFINSGRILSVTGDFGNWVFCRKFIPSADGVVSDYYWLEKLHIGSEQKGEKYSPRETTKRIDWLISEGLEEWGIEEDTIPEAKEWLKELRAETDDEVGYMFKAYRDYDKPDCLDYESIPFEKEIHRWLLVIFDAFENICERLKEEDE